MSNWQPINKPKGELSSPYELPPEESEPEYPERITFSPFECLLHFGDFPELHNLAKEAQREGRSGLTYPEIEEAKAQIVARGEDKETRARIIDQHLAARIDQPYGHPAQTPQQSAQTSQTYRAQARNPRRSQDHSEGASLSATTGNTNIELVPLSDAQTPSLVPSFIHTAGRAQQERTPTGQSVTSPCIEKTKSQTAGPRPDSQIGAEDSFHSLAPNQSEFSKSIKPDRNLYPPLHRFSDRTAFDKDLIWQLEHPRFFGYSKPYREHPPLGPIKSSSLLQDPRFNYLQSSYHETETLLRSLEGKTTWPGPSLVDPFYATLPRRRVGVEDLRNQPLTNEIFAWHWQPPQYK